MAGVAGPGAADCPSWQSAQVGIGELGGLDADPAVEGLGAVGWAAERGFRDLKSSLLLRPVFHRLEHRIRAHVLLCWLALLLIRVAERRTSMTWRRIAIELGHIHAVTLTGTAGTAVHTTPLSTTEAGILRDWQVTPPPRITALDPA